MYTVEGELGVAGFLVNYFSGVHFQTLCGCAPLPGCTPKVPLLIVIAERSQFLPILRLTVQVYSYERNLCPGLQTL
jgi:hypothetical protein